MKYGKITEELIRKLIEITDRQNVITDEEKLSGYSHDETPPEQYGHLPDVVVTPINAAEVSKILSLANTLRIPVTPRGAGSGLFGGAIPIYGGILLSMEKMNRIIEIDTKNLMAVVEPGVITNEINEKVAEFGLFFAGYPMSLETCFIGGNIAENAGGGRAVKYGVTERYIMGLEVVLPTGEMVQLGGKRVKDVTGYDLKKLFIGSEGTLGIITKAIIKLMPLPAFRVALLALFRNVEDAINVVPRIFIDTRIVPSSIEFMDRLSFITSCRYLNERLDYRNADAMLLIEVDGNREEQVEDEYELIGDLCMNMGAFEVYVSDNRTTIERLWSIRRNIPEAFLVESPQQSLEDIVVPISDIPAVIPEIKRISEKYNIQIPCYGHAGDGNLHATLVKNPDFNTEEWYRVENKALRELYRAVKKLGGTISGEHGIGSKRKQFLKYVMSDVEIELMRKIKKAIDPNNILNPGKIFDIE